MSTERPSGFDERCLAEAVRLHELEHGRLPDAAEVATARLVASGLEARVVARGSRLAQREGLDSALAAWNARAAAVAAVALLLAFLGGIGAAFAVAGDGARPINVVWALGGLLGLHLVMLLVWVAGVFVSGSPQAGFGAVWAWVGKRMGGPAAHVARASFALHGRSGLLRWWFGSVTHAVWSLALSGAVVGLILTFLLRGHAFIWETTLLPAGFFVRFVEVAGALPALVGFAVPDPALIAASGAGAVADEAARRQWASWLLGCVLFYGVLPRAALLAVCQWKLKRGRAAFRLDTAQPGFAELADVLAPASERIGVTDAAPQSIATARLQARQAMRGRAALAGVELRPDVVWPVGLPERIRDLGSADGREARARMKQALESEPARRLLVVCDARLSPDRGSLGFVAELSGGAGECRVWLAGADAESARVERWRESLGTIGISEAGVFVDIGAALEWLGEQDE